MYPTDYLGRMADGQSGIIIFFFEFYYDKAKTFCRGFSDIENFYVTLNRSDVSEHWDVGKHVGVLSYIQLCRANLGGIWTEYIFLVFT